MIKVIETFSGIGSQAQALENIGVDFEILHTVDWDINAILAYDLIHHGKQDLEPYNNFTKKELLERLQKYTISMDGKKPATIKNYHDLSEDLMKRILCAIDRSKNLVSITDVTANDLPNEIDLLTYSFPCQDLSVAGNWHGNKSGIDRGAHNRSGMLWEIERILKERVDKNMKLPQFLLMENVSNILSNRHINNFTSWTDYLESIGYYNKIYTLDASKFGIPQKRVRTYMLSVQTNNNMINRVKIDNYFKAHDLQDDTYIKTLRIKERNLKDFLRLDYRKKQYRIEADLCQPNNTPSREEIYQTNPQIVKGKKVVEKFVPTVTTKQDRHPNSGVIDYDNGKVGKSKFRYLTPRECFLLMGFKEESYDSLIDNNFIYRQRKFFNIEKLNKMAGNSIVVPVLEEIFKQVEYIKNNILNDSKKVSSKSGLSMDSIKNELAALFEAKKKAYQVIK